VLFTPRCTSVQVLGEKLGQRDLSQNGRTRTDRRHDVAHAHARRARPRRPSPACVFPKVARLPEVPLAFPRPHSPQDASKSPPPRATLSPPDRTGCCPPVRRECAARAPTEALPYHGGIPPAPRKPPIKRPEPPPAHPSPLHSVSVRHRYAMATATGHLLVPSSKSAQLLRYLP
jgi:hypothetical protein